MNAVSLEAYKKSFDAKAQRRKERQENFCSKRRGAMRDAVFIGK